MGGCFSRDKGPPRGVKPELYTALYDYDAPGKLRFRKNDTLVVIGSEDRFTFLGHVQGQRQTGTFPSTYVKRHDDIGTSSTNPAYANNARTASNASRGSRPSAGASSTPAQLVVMQSRTKAGEEQNEPGRLSFVKTRSPSQSTPLPPAPPPPTVGKTKGAGKGKPLRSCLKGTAPAGAKQQARAKGIRFAKRNPPAGQTHHPSQYERAGSFDAARSQVEWEREEEAEIQRMLEFRWQIMERDLPPGTRCAERAEIEDAAAARAEREAHAKEERRRKFREARATNRKEQGGTTAARAAVMATSGRSGPAVVRSDSNGSGGGGGAGGAWTEGGRSGQTQSVTITMEPEEPRRRGAMAASRPTGRPTGRPPPPPPAPPGGSRGPPVSFVVDDVDVDC
eukprot:m.155773 g.155773  ORF g.155773 m.155773 type:complete len:394 (+) comp14419_c0_seq3:224-1405(+)